MIAAAANDNAQSREALEVLCRAYWRPVYIYTRRIVSNPEAAQDLTQEFFARVLERNLLAVADAQKGRFRTFLLTLLKRFLADEHDHANAQKRGGGRAFFSLEDLAEAEEILPSASAMPDEEFDRRWALATLDAALRSLAEEARAAGQEELFRALAPTLSGGDSGSSMAELAERFGMGESAIKMRLSRWRERCRKLLREAVERTVPQATDVEQEMRHLLGALRR